MRDRAATRQTVFPGTVSRISYQGAAGDAHMEIGYSDFIRICRVENPADFAGYAVKNDGIYVNAPPDNVDLTPEERAVLSEHPTGNLNDPALSFPCSFHEFRSFMEKYLCGYTDPFELADFIMVHTPKAPYLDENNLLYSSELKIAIEAWQYAADKTIKPEYFKNKVEGYLGKQKPKPTNEAIKRIAVLTNPDGAKKGGAPKKEI